MTECNHRIFEYPTTKGRKIQASFTGGEVSSDGGVMLLRQADRRLGLTEAVSQALDDSRRTASCRHSLKSLLRQRVYGLALGYEDLNDHQSLRRDPAIQSAVERDELLASSPTLCRWENRANRQTALEIHKVLIDQFIASHRRAPKELILDFDATDDAVHGNQEGRFFHGYYDHYCFLPLYVFCGDRLLVSYLRKSNIDGAKHSWAILSLLVKRFRQVWPKVSIIFRGDSGFCRWRMLSWCERHDVNYIIGMAKNSRLLSMSEGLAAAARSSFESTGEKSRLFGNIAYAAGTWNRERRIIAKAEHTRKGSNPRFVVTNLVGEAQQLYDKVYCLRGDMENRIKEQQLNLFSDRTSCHRWWPNQLRLLLSGLAYVLLEAIRRLALISTELARAQAGTIRLKLLKIGAVVLRNTRRVQLLLSSSYPYQELFFKVATRLKSP